MMKEEIQKSCFNCKHFRAHYAESSMRCKISNCGHCIKRNITKKDFMRFPHTNGCSLWESDENEKRRKREYAEYMIAKTYEYLKDIANILKADQ